GMFFHRDNWLGGYGSLKRRMYRLGHIAFFGLGAVNLMFWLTVKIAGLSGTLAGIASWAFVVGAITMPLCCGVMAHAPKLHMIFAVPVISLLIGGALTLTLILRQPGDITHIETGYALRRQSAAATALSGAGRLLKTGEISVEKRRGASLPAAVQNEHSCAAMVVSPNLRPDSISPPASGRPARSKPTTNGHQ
ncbi:MAG TPA: hypothetical protein PKA41_16185, partial [Verrucomicrobiota bacterium]|nr:hypothetical protein [Verrucomicrobiota bacterium]